MFFRDKSGFHLRNLTEWVKVAGRVLAIIATVCVLIYLFGLGSHIDSAIDQLTSDVSKPFVAREFSKKSASLNSEEFPKNAVWRHADARRLYVEHVSSPPPDDKQFSGLTVVFFAVAYTCARYAVGIEHPLQWYRDTRMKNIMKDDETNSERRPSLSS